MIFVDTGFWIALKNKDDKYHPKANLLWGKILQGEITGLVTTDYILDESITHASRNKNWGTWEKGVAVGEAILESTEVVLEYVRESDVSKAWELFRKYQDKKLSFTDCVSMAVMGRLGATQIMTFDSDFKRVGRGYIILDS